LQALTEDGNSGTERYLLDRFDECCGAVFVIDIELTKM
jgi:hypothetical protein